MPRSREQNLTLVAKYRKKRPLRQSGASGDLRNGGVLEPALAEESKGCLLESAVAVGLPTVMRRSYSMMTATDIPGRVMTATDISRPQQRGSTNGRCDS